jgi:gluconokinase
MLQPVNALVVMGVSGCGKSSIAQAIAQRSGASLIEGDAFHPPANIAKMRSGTALTDADRAGWLSLLGEQLQQAVGSGQRVVLTCSALKHSYREQLRAAVSGLGFIYLQLSREVAAERVAQRPGHFMPASLIDSQFATLEAPLGEPLTLALDATAAVEQLADQASHWWSAQALA